MRGGAVRRGREGCWVVRPRIRGRVLGLGVRGRIGAVGGAGR